MEKIWEKYNDAYITLEMTCIMPFVIFLICNICYMAIFLYDNCTMIQGDYVTALISERALGEEKRSKAEIKYNEAIKSKIVAADESSSIEIENDGTRIETQIEVNTPGEFLYKSNWKMSNSIKADKYEPVLFIRNTKVASEIIKGQE